MRSFSEAESTVNILLIEDNPADVELTRETMHDSKILTHLFDVSDAEQALQFLYQKEPFENAPTPDFIFLDLNLPGKSGTELLKTIKEDPKLRLIPVAVLTTSNAEADVIESYNLGANCYLNKPVGLNEFSELIKKFEEFWFAVVRLPFVDR